MIRTIEGPLFMTSCSAATADCEQSDRCTVREPLRKVSRTIEEVLNKLTIWDMTEPEHEACAGVGDAGLAVEQSRKSLGEVGNHEH